MAVPNLIKLVGGDYVVEKPITTSAGAGSADKVPALDASGKIDSSMIPSGNSVTDEMAIAYSLIFG